MYHNPLALLREGATYVRSCPSGTASGGKSRPKLTHRLPEEIEQNGHGHICPARSSDPIEGDSVRHGD